MVLSQQLLSRQSFFFDILGLFVLAELLYYGVVWVTQGLLESATVHPPDHLQQDHQLTQQAQHIIIVGFQLALLACPQTTDLVTAVIFFVYLLYAWLEVFIVIHFQHRLQESEINCCDSSQAELS